MKVLKYVFVSVAIIVLTAAYLNPSTESFAGYVRADKEIWEDSDGNEFLFMKKRNYIIFSVFEYKRNWSGAIDRETYYGFLGNFMRRD